METIIRVKEYQIDTLPYFIASIDGAQYKGLVVQSYSIIGCLEELKKSLHVLELYHKQSKTK